MLNLPCANCTAKMSAQVVVRAAFDTSHCILTVILFGFL